DLEDARLFAGLARAGLDLTGDAGLLRAEVLQSIARVHWLQGDVERMLPMLAEAREILTAQLGARSPEVAAAQLELAVALGRLGRVDEALARLLAARSIYEEHYGPLHPALARLHFNLSAAYADLGQLDEGFAASARAVELLTAGGAPPEDIAAARLNLVELLLRAGRAADALPIAREIEVILARAYGPSSLAVSNARLALGETLHDLGRIDEAIPAYHDAWTLQRARLGDTSPETTAARVRYAHALALRDPAAALALLPDVDALPGELAGLALLTRAQARLALATEPASARADALRARASLPGRTARQALLHREVEAVVALTPSAPSAAPPRARGASATSARAPAPR
ncbi:MAG: tetratricopeptide repeat protein, partial [Myxococcales bacterium]|nr:tetratricopeptide repeat protein [Myxococcales bacterium]